MKCGKRLIAGVFAAVLSLGLTACSSVKFEPTETSIFIQKDRKVVSAEIESFDNSAYADSPRYKEDELKAFVEDAVITYNSENGGAAKAYVEEKGEELPVAVESLTVADNTATLLLDFASADDYSSVQWNRRCSSGEGSDYRNGSGRCEFRTGFLQYGECGWNGC